MHSRGHSLRPLQLPEPDQQGSSYSILWAVLSHPPQCAAEEADRALGKGLGRHLDLGLATNADREWRIGRLQRNLEAVKGAQRPGVSTVVDSRNRLQRNQPRRVMLVMAIS